MKKSKRPRQKTTVIVMAAVVTLAICRLAMTVENSIPAANQNEKSRAFSQSALITQFDPTRGVLDDTSDSWVMVELTKAPSIQVYFDTLDRTSKQMGKRIARQQAVRAAQSQISAIEATQRSVVNVLTKSEINAAILFRTQRVFNGIAIRVRRDCITKIRCLPHVQAIHALEAVQASRSSSVPFIGVPDVWMSSTGITGENISIGVLDSGIDYLHSDFGGTGDPHDYEDNDTTILEGDFFPNTKVVGGWDFVGDDYDGDNEAIEDPDPMDCMGHGTHVAGIAAGFGVTAEGNTYGGSYNATSDLDDLLIGPGVAPRAEIYALRVFGCTGKTRLLIRAIEWATDPNGDGDFSDHLDIINMSLGSRYGSPDTVSAIATENAARIGVIAVSAAGNYEDAYYITDSPASATRAISVAASRDDGLIFDGLRIDEPASIAGNIAASLASFAPDPGDPGISAAIVNAVPSQACAELTNGGEVEGAFALVDMGGCPADFKTQMVQNAGAVGMVVVHEGPWLPYSLDGDSSNITIPVLSISHADGSVIKQSGSNTKGTLSSAFSGPRSELADTLTFLSSRGPRVGDSQIKPDIVAPGTNIESAAFGTGMEASESTGTSMSTPHVSGAMALLRQIHQDWSVEELKALIMNTALHDLIPDPDSASTRYGPGRVGAGRIDVAAAARSEAVAYSIDPPGAVSVSFGLVEVVDETRMSREVRVVNRGSESVTYRLAYEAYAAVPGVEISFPEGDEITVAGEGSLVFPVQLHAIASQMRNTVDESAQTDPTLKGVHRFWLSEETGYISLIPIMVGEMFRLRIPLYAAARPASSLAVTQKHVLLTGSKGSFVLNLKGREVDSGENPPSIRSRLSVFELQEYQPQLTVTDNPIADLDIIGVTSDYKARVALGERFEDSVVSFGVVTHQEWNSPNQVAIKIWIDRDLDGDDDFLLYNKSILTLAWSESDSFWVKNRELSDSTGSRQYYLNGFSPTSVDTVLFNNRAFVFPVLVSELGLSEGSSEFAYRVESYYRSGSDWFLAGVSDIHRFDPANPGLHLSGVNLAPFFWPDRDGQIIPVDYDTEAFRSTDSLGILLIHHHNKMGSHAEVVGVSLNEPRRVWGRVRP